MQSTLVSTVVRNLKSFLVVFSILATFGFTYSLAQAPTLQTGLTVGESCTVSSGPNKGKKGTITHEAGEGYWCEGSWGGTQCSDSKCNTSKVSGRDLLTSIVQPMNQTVYAQGIATAQALQCSDDGRVCFDCHYDTNGKLLYCDVITLPPVRQPAAQLLTPSMNSNK